MRQRLQNHSLIFSVHYDRPHVVTRFALCYTGIYTLCCSYTVCPEKQETKIFYVIYSIKLGQF